MNVHFIAIGGSAMHNLAIAMHLMGDVVTGSDDEIFHPSKGRLMKYGLLPSNIGWDESKIHDQLEAVILGMHARSDNPELIKAQQLGLKIYSYPEFIYEKTKCKKRIVIGGSHGKTTITSMILHVLNYNGIIHDYMVGAQLDGFECMVRLSDDAKIAVLEGDEYLSSPIDPRPKFHLYQPTIGLISGIAWDHINVFPTFQSYVEQFDIFANLIKDSGYLIYYTGDQHIKKIKNSLKDTISQVGYSTHNHLVEDGKTYLIDGKDKYPVLVFGEHNLQNLSGALEVCLKIGLDKKQFYEAIQSFSGASKRMELVAEKDNTVVYKDFAHSPSKLKATTEALSNQFPDRRLVACMELHTFSSLNSSFLEQYRGSMYSADVAYVYFSPETLKHKKLKEISADDIHEAFGSDNLVVFTSSVDLVNALKSINWNNTNLLLMSSGNFGGIEIKDLAKSLLT